MPGCHPNLLVLTNLIGGVRAVKALLLQPLTHHISVGREPEPQRKELTRTTGHHQNGWTRASASLQEQLI
jgi:hypothetical protein